MMLFEYLILPTFTAVAGGLIVYFVTRWFRKRERVYIRQEFSIFSGKWYGIHLTRDTEGKIVISRHEYDLEVSATGKIKGSLADDVKQPLWCSTIDGILSGAGMVLVMEANFRPGYLCAQFHREFSADEVNYGILAGYNVNGDVFAAPIAVSRKPLTPRDVEQAIEVFRANVHVDILDENLDGKDQAVLGGEE